MNIQEQYFKGVPDYYPSMYLDGYTPQQIMYAVRNNDNKYKRQRQFCGCINSKDIGQYNTCPHLCEYCYANSSKEIAVSNWKKHKGNPYGDNILGK